MSSMELLRILHMAPLSLVYFDQIMTVNLIFVCLFDSNCSMNREMEDQGPKLV